MGKNVRNLIIGSLSLIVGATLYKVLSPKKEKQTEEKARVYHLVGTALVDGKEIKVS